MNKCKWHDGKFEPCDNFDGVVHPQDMHTYHRYICKHCGADIQKPELEEPLIVQSGESWVAYDKGIDYLWTYEAPKDQPYLKGTTGIIMGGWESFTGPKPDITELTDDIAKLRPIVIRSTGNKAILYGIDKNTAIYLYENGHIELCHLATAKELQEAE